MNQPETAAEDRPAAPPKRRGRLWWALWVSGALVLVLVLALGGLFFERQSHFDSNIHRIPDVFPKERAQPGAEGSETWLLLGSDRRSESRTTGSGTQNNGWKPGAQRADTIMLVHLPENRKHIYLVSFPRDSWVEIPGHGSDKLNAAFSYGGPSLLIATLEQLTQVRIDHFSVLDFAGFKQMTDAVGGVDVSVKNTVQDPINHVTWRAGRNHLDGELALKFVRQRYNLPGGDFDRIKRQQAFLKALMAKVADKGTLTSPLKLNAFLDAFTKSVSVDAGVSAGDLRSLALGFRGIRQNDITFMTVPVIGTATIQKQSVVRIDKKKARPLYSSLQNGTVDAYLEEQGEANTVDTVQ